MVECVHSHPDRLTNDCHSQGIHVNSLVQIRSGVSAAIQHFFCIRFVVYFILLLRAFSPYPIMSHKLHTMDSQPLSRSALKPSTPASDRRGSLSDLGYVIVRSAIFSRITKTKPTTWHGKRNEDKHWTGYKGMTRQRGSRTVKAVLNEVWRKDRMVWLRGE